LTPLQVLLLYVTGAHLYNDVKLSPASFCEFKGWPLNWPHWLRKAGV
jgi:hypothetical protein